MRCGCSRVFISDCITVFAQVQRAVTQPQTPQNAPAQGGEIPRQEQNKTVQPEKANERWNIFWQATSIGQYHGTFRSPYEGPNSLRDTPERDASVTSTLYFGLRLFENTQIYLDGELAGGRGVSDVVGIANFPNGEMPRVSSATPKPNLARAYVQQDFGFGSKREDFDSDENQLAGSRPMNRYTLIVGRFSAEHFFENDSYSHDPRTQFMSWGTMYNAAFDYPADTRGYTWGWYTNCTSRTGLFAMAEWRSRKWPMGHSSTGEFSGTVATCLKSSGAMLRALTKGLFV